MKRVTTNVVNAVSIGRRLIGGGHGGVRRVRSAIIGIALSLLPLLLVLQVAEGMILGIAERFIETGTAHMQARPRFGSAEQSLERISGELESIDGVLLATPEKQGLALAYTDAGRAGATVRAVVSDFWERDGRFRALMTVDEGEFDLSGPSPAVLGRDMARRLGVQPGDSVRLLTVRTSGSDRVLPRVSTFTVTGIVSSGYQDLDRLWIFIPYDRGVRVLPDESSRSRILIKIDDPFGIENPLFQGDGRGAEIRATVDRHLPDGWILNDWFGLERSQYMSFLATRNLLLFVMFLIVCVASVNISSTLATLSIEKREELAILKSTGASSTDIRIAFLTAGFLIGFIGAILGIAIGLALAVHINELLWFMELVINASARLVDLLVVPLGGEAIGRVEVISSEFYLERIPIRIDALATTVAAGVAILVATVSSVLPAERAAAIRPLEVLRKH